MDVSSQKNFQVPNFVFLCLFLLKKNRKQLSLVAFVSVSFVVKQLTVGFILGAAFSYRAGPRPDGPARIPATWMPVAFLAFSYALGNILAHVLAFGYNPDSIVK